MANQKKSTRMLLAMALASSILVLPGKAQSPGSTSSPTPATAAPAAGTPFRFQPDRSTWKAGRYYSMVWGIDSISVKYAESGEIIRFSYRVLDPIRAKMLNDKKLEPSLIDPEKGVKLVVPSLENVGALRQSSAPEAGKTYWMAFSNSGRLIRRGDRVTVMIGDFQAQGLDVE